MGLHPLPDATEPAGELCLPLAAARCSLPAARTAGPAVPACLLGFFGLTMAGQRWCHTRAPPRRFDELMPNLAVGFHIDCVTGPLQGQTLHLDLLETMTLRMRTVQVSCVAKPSSKDQIKVDPTGE